MAKDIQDTFNRADSNIDGSTSSDAQFTWIQLPKATAMTVATNRASLIRPAADRFEMIHTSIEMDTANHYAQVDIVSMGPKSQTGVGIRLDAGRFDGTDNGYVFVLNTIDNAFYLQDLNGFVTLRTASGGGATSGTLYMEMQGSNYLCKSNGVTIFSGSDSAHAGGVGNNKVGYVASVLTNVSETVLSDNFRAADLVAVATDFAGPSATIFRVRLRSY
jgi:hypothetical protein